MFGREVVPHVVAAAATWGRRGTGAFVIWGSCLALAANAQGVAPECPTRPSGRQLTPGWYIAPQTGVTQSAGRLLLGWPYLSWRGGIEEVTTPDTNGVGLIIGPRGRPTVIPQPVPQHLFDSPKVRVVDARSVDVIFSANTTRPPMGDRVDSLLVWGGRLRDGQWRDVSRIAQLPATANDLNQIVGDGTAHRGELVAAFLSDPHGAERGDVVLIRGTAPTWRVDRVHPLLVNTSYADLLSFRDTLWLAVAAGAVYQSDLPQTFGVWLMHESATGWSRPRLIVGGNGKTMREPRLIGNPQGLLVSWVDGEGESARLRWRAASSATPGEIRQRPIHFQTTRGLESWRHLIGASVNDTTAQILELSASGSRVVAEFRTAMGIAPLVLGNRDRPVAIVPGVAKKLVPIPYWLVEHDLRCVAAPRGVGPRGLAAERNDRASFTDARPDSPP